MLTSFFITRQSQNPDLYALNLKARRAKVSARASPHIRAIAVSRSRGRAPRKLVPFRGKERFCPL